VATALSGIRLNWQRMDRYGTFATPTQEVRTVGS